MTSLIPESERVGWELSPEPGWLQTASGAAFCWYHEPRGPKKDTAVILCDPLGSDRMNLHLAYRHLALNLAHAGYATLRIDYPGTCDSEGSPRDPRRLDAWLGSLNAGADYLKRRSGAGRLAAFGALTGGTLACCLAAQREDVAKVAVWGGYTRGREFVRAAKMLERMSGGNPQQTRPPHWREGDMEWLGFYLSEATVSELKSIDLCDMQFPSLEQALLLEWDELSNAQPLADHMREQGMSVTHCNAPLDVGAHCLERQEVPWRLIERLHQWLLTDDNMSGSGIAEAGTFALESTVQLGDAGTHEVITEQVIQAGDDGEIFCIMTQPQTAAAAAEAPTIVIVNGGNNHRVGINRSHTEWARAWAALGFRVVRFDIRGLGDSPPQDAADLNVLYRRETAEDVTRVLDQLESELAIRRFILIGFCAGAYQALHAARTDERVVGLALLELLRLYPEPFEWLPCSQRTQSALRRRWFALVRRAQLGRTRLYRWLNQMTARGTRILVVYRRDEPMLEEFRQEAGSVLTGSTAADQIDISLLDPSNHILSPLYSQTQLRAAVEEWITTQFARATRVELKRD